MTTAMTAITTALRGFPVFLIFDHASYRQGYHAKHYCSCYDCSHSILLFSFTAYFTFDNFLVSTFKVRISLYGLKSRYRIPATRRNATTVQIPKLPAEINMPI